MECGIFNTSTWSAWPTGSGDTACAVAETLAWRTAWSSHPCNRSVWTARPDVTPLGHVDRWAYVAPRRVPAPPGSSGPYPGRAASALPRVLRPSGQRSGSRGRWLHAPSWRGGSPGGRHPLRLVLCFALATHTTSCSGNCRSDQVVSAVRPPYRHTAVCPDISGSETLRQISWRPDLEPLRMRQGRV